jgi:DNA-binding LytR/AlgR family response regulator
MGEEKRKILIVDDDPGLRKSLGTFLTAGGYDTQAEEDGVAVARTLEKWKPDLVVLDLKMPNKDGWEVISEIRADPRTEDLPVIFLTGVTDDDSKVLGFRSGADDYIVKPFHPLELMARIDRMLETRGRAVLKASGIGSLPVRTGGRIAFVPWDDICFMQASGKYTYVHTPTERHLSDCSLKEIESALSGKDGFFRVHRSYLINLEKVAGVAKEGPNKYAVEMADEPGTVIYISQRRLPEFKKILHLHI